jgi:hypothetical protein
MISGFCHNTDEICALLGYKAALSGNSLPTFWDNISVPSSTVKKSKKIRTDMLSQNVSKILPLDAAFYPRREQISYKQCVYDITLRHICVTICHGETISINYYLCVCVCSCLSYPACKLHLFRFILYCHLWPVWLYHIFPHYLMNGTIFRKKLWNVKVFSFSLQLLFEMFLILRRIERGINVCICRS